MILDLKADLDKSYETASTLADDQSGNKDAIRQLLAVVMSTVRSAAAGDPMAEQQLDEEEEARTQHFRFLEYPLVADMLDPDSCIEEDELVAVLLTEDEKSVGAILEILDSRQLVALVSQAQQLMAETEKPPQSATDRLEQLETALASLG